MFRNKPTIPHPSMSSRYKSNNVENIRFGVLRNNVSNSDMFQWHPSKKIWIDPSSSDGQRPNSGRGIKNNEIRKENFLHSTSEFDKETSTKSRTSINRGSNIIKNRSNSGARN